jgi:hypothetical protein
MESARDILRRRQKIDLHGGLENGMIVAKKIYLVDSLLGGLQFEIEHHFLFGGWRGFETRPGGNFQILIFFPARRSERGFHGIHGHGLRGVLAVLFMKEDNDLVRLVEISDSRGVLLEKNSQGGSPDCSDELRGGSGGRRGLGGRGLGGSVGRRGLGVVFCRSFGVGLRRHFLRFNSVLRSVLVEKREIGHEGEIIGVFGHVHGSVQKRNFVFFLGLIHGSLDVFYAVTLGEVSGVGKKEKAEKVEGGERERERENCRSRRRRKKEGKRKGS